MQRERKRGGEREAVRRLQHYVWRAPSIKQVFEKGRQREKVSAKYLKECREERGARPEGDKAVSRTLRPAPVSLDRVTLLAFACACVFVCAHLRAHPFEPAELDADIPEWSASVHGPVRSLTKL